LAVGAVVPLVHDHPFTVRYDPLESVPLSEVGGAAVPAEQHGRRGDLGIGVQAYSESLDRFEVVDLAWHEFAEARDRAGDRTMAVRHPVG
jgi:hypothetical protein